MRQQNVTSKYRTDMKILLVGNVTKDVYKRLLWTKSNLEHWLKEMLYEDKVSSLSWKGKHLKLGYIIKNQCQEKSRDEFSKQQKDGGKETLSFEEKIPKET